MLLPADPIRTLYISGKMRGIEHFNIPLFNKVAEELRGRGFKVFNPADNPGGLSWEEYMELDIPMVCASDGVVVIDDRWKDSPGARYEVYICQTILKKPILQYPTLAPEPLWLSPALEAQGLVFGDRNSDYGHPLDDMSCTADMITALFKRWFFNVKEVKDVKFEAEHIPQLMIAVKQSREAGHHKQDNLVDMAGYAVTRWMIKEERARRKSLELESIQPEKSNAQTQIKWRINPPREV